MIEKMKMVHVVSSVSRKQELLEGLRDLGILHLAEKKSASRGTSERFTSLSRTSMALTDYVSKDKRTVPMLRFFLMKSLKKCITASSHAWTAKHP